MDILNKAKDLASGVVGTALNVLSGGVAGKVGAVIDAINLPPAERALLRREAQEAIHEEVLAHVGIIQQQIDATTQIIVAELQSGSWITKNARPLICLYLTLFLSAAVWTGKEVPSEFMYCWTGLCGTWMVSRGVEKVGKGNKVTQLITGTDLRKAA